MTRDQYIIRRKLNLVELGEVLGNVSEACRKLSVSRQHYYDIKKTLQEEGVEGLLEKARTKPKVANRVAPEIEEKVLAYSLEFPTHGQVRVENELKRQGVISSNKALPLPCVWHWSVTAQLPPYSPPSGSP